MVQLCQMRTVFRGHNHYYFCKPLIVHRGLVWTNFGFSPIQHHISLKRSHVGSSQQILEEYLASVATGHWPPTHNVLFWKLWTGSCTQNPAIPNMNNLLSSRLGTYFPPSTTRERMWAGKSAWCRLTIPWVSTTLRPVQPSLLNSKREGRDNSYKRK